MSACQLYLDEDTSDADLVFALRQRDIDVSTAIEAGRKAATDEDHLLWGAATGRVLYTFNARDFCALHKQFLMSGRGHAGVIIGVQQRYSVGEQMRRLLRLIGKMSAQEMRNRVEFLSNW